MSCLGKLVGTASRSAAVILIAGSTFGITDTASAVFLETRLLNPSNGFTEAVDSTSVEGPVDILGQVIVSSGTITYNDSTYHGELRIDADHFKATSACVNVTRRHVATMEFADLVIDCPDSSYVNARLNLDFQGFAAFTGPNRIGTVLLDVTVRMAGTSAMVGRWIPRSSFASELSSGIFAGVSRDTLSGVYTTPAFRVPVGQPMPLVVIVAADVGAGGCNRPGGDRTLLDFSSDGRRIGFPIDAPVFLLPNGGSAQSAEARIVANIWTPTPPNIEALCDAGGPYAGIVGETVMLDGSGSSDSDGLIVAYEWDFGDGSTGSGSVADHAYGAIGDYRVILCVTDDGGARTCCETVASISPPPNVEPLCDAGGPYAGTAGEAVTLDASGSSDSDGLLVAYEWDFGDGSVGSGATVSHTYDLPGAYDVTLCVTDDDGAHVCCEAGAEIVAPPRAQLALDIRPGECPNPLNPKSRGVLPAAILASAGLDVRDIDPSSIRLMDTVAPEQWAIDDVATPVASPEECACSASGDDGLDDLTLKFDTRAVVATLPGGRKGDRIAIRVTGNLRDGTAFEATDCVLLVQDLGTGSQRSSDPMLGGYGKLQLTGTDPNPFRTQTQIRFSLESAARVQVTIYDASGRVVRRLLDAPTSGGEHSVQWDAEGLPSGVYFYRVEVDGHGETRKAILAR